MALPRDLEDKQDRSGSRVLLIAVLILIWGLWLVIDWSSIDFSVFVRSASFLRANGNALLMRGGLDFGFLSRFGLINVLFKGGFRPLETLSSLGWISEGLRAVEGGSRLL